MQIFVTKRDKEDKVATTLKLTLIGKDLISGTSRGLELLNVKRSLSDVVDDQLKNLLESDVRIYQIDEQQFRMIDLLKIDLENIIKNLKNELDNEAENLFESIREDLKENYSEDAELSVADDLEEDNDADEEKLEGLINERLEELVEENEEEAFFDAAYDYMNDYLKQYFDSGLDYVKYIENNLYEDLIKYIKILYQKLICSLDVNMLALIGILFNGKQFYLTDADRIYRNNYLLSKIKDNYFILYDMISTLKTFYNVNDLLFANGDNIKSLLQNDFSASDLNMFASIQNF